MPLQLLKNLHTGYIYIKQYKHLCSDDVRSHMGVDFINFAYYIADICVPPIKKEEFLASLGDVFKSDKVSELTEYFRCNSSLKMMICESGPFRRFDLPSTYTTYKAWAMAFQSTKYAPTTDLRLNHLADLAAITLLIEPEAKPDNPYHPFKDNPLQLVAEFHKTTMDNFRGLSSPFLTSFNEFCQTIRTADPLKVPEILRFTYDCLITRLYEPQICQQFNESLKATPL